MNTMGNRTKKAQKVNKKVLIATIDIGKRSHHGYWRSYNGDDCKPFEFANTRKGFDLFWHKIRAASIMHKAEEIIVGFESTGSYWEPLVHYLRTKPVELVQVNPMHTKRIKELDDNSPRKTDQKDPRVIADIIQHGHYLTLVVPTGAAAELRRLTNARESKIAKRTASINRLQDLLGIIFPEFLTIMKGIKTKSAQYLLERYLRPEDIAALGCNGLAKKLHKISRGKLGPERAQALISAAKNTIGVTEGIESICMEIRQLLEDISSYNMFIYSCCEKMEAYLEKIPYSRYLLSIKGFGIVTVAGIIGEVADFNAFHSQKAILKLAGLNLFEVSSGIHKGIRRISKRGRSRLRKILYFAALNVVRKGGILHQYYQKLINRGMLRIKALTAVMRKLLRIMFALVRDKTTYNREYSLKKAA